MSEYLDIDGSVLEGGGQILRISIALSAILGVPVRVFNIRAGRCKPGLAAQHLKGIQVVAEMCQAKLQGASIGSTEVSFAPGKIRGGHYIADTHTAGSISLLLQIALPCALFADGPVTLDLLGGTNADMAPQVDYMVQVFRPILKMFNADFQINIRRRGYFPRGGGHVTVEIMPVRRLRGVSLTERGRVVSVRGSSFVAGVLPMRLAEQMAEGAKRELRQIFDHVDIHCYKEDPVMAPDSCSGIVLWAVLSSGCVLGTDGLGRRGVDSFELGLRAGADLRRVLQSGICLDYHCQDQVILFMALAAGPSAQRTDAVTLHTKTAMHVAELIAKIKFCVQSDGEHNIVGCSGLAFTNNSLPPE